MDRLSWIIWVGPNFNHMYSYKEGDEKFHIHRDCKDREERDLKILALKMELGQECE